MNIIKVAIIEDDRDDSRKLTDYLEQYIHDNNISMMVRVFRDGEQFLYSGEQFHLVFMDIELPGKNGIDTAAELRKRGGEEVLVLVTNMVRYAVHGYSVKAVDYMVKPVQYEQLALKLPGFISMIKRRNHIIVRNRLEMVKIDIRDIRYIEIYSHEIIVHLDGKTEKCHGTLKEYEEQLIGNGFVKCSQSCLVNLAHIDRISQNTVSVAGDELQISRRERKVFIEEFTKFDGGYGI